MYIVYLVTLIEWGDDSRVYVVCSGSQKTIGIGGYQWFSTLFGFLPF